jgi:hypothetical protein
MPAGSELTKCFSDRDIADKYVESWVVRGRERPQLLRSFRDGCAALVALGSIEHISFVITAKSFTDSSQIDDITRRETP